jgi:hypothetical protein
MKTAGSTKLPAVFPQSETKTDYLSALSCCRIGLGPGALTRLARMSPTGAGLP